MISLPPLKRNQACPALYHKMVGELIKICSTLAVATDIQTVRTRKKVAKDTMLRAAASHRTRCKHSDGR